MKVYQKIYKNATTAQCKTCDKFLPIECFG